MRDLTNVPETMRAYSHDTYHCLLPKCEFFTKPYFVAARTPETDPAREQCPYGHWPVRGVDG